MLVRFRANLGTIDAHALKQATGVALKAQDYKLDSEHEMPDEAAEWLAKKKIVDLLEPKSISGVAKQSEIEAVPPRAGSVEKAEADLKSYRKRASGEGE